MNTPTRSVQVHSDHLRRLGFNDAVVSEVVRAHQLGLFGEEPPEDLVERTIAACQDLFASMKAKEPAGFSACVPALSRVEQLFQACVTTMFADQGDRLVTLLDNHNVVQPTWWVSDTGFSAMGDMLRKLGEWGRQEGTPSSEMFVVLLPKSSMYSVPDLRAVSETISAAAGDVWLVPYRQAGKFQEREDVLVGDNVCAITLEGRRSNSGQRYKGIP